LQDVKDNIQKEPANILRQALSCDKNISRMSEAARKYEDVSSRLVYVIW